MSEKLLCIQHRKVIGRIHIAERAIASDLPEWQIAIADSGIDKNGNVIPIPEDDDDE